MDEGVHVMSGQLDKELDPKIVERIYMDADRAILDRREDMRPRSQWNRSLIVVHGRGVGGLAPGFARIASGMAGWLIVAVSLAERT